MSLLKPRYTYALENGFWVVRNPAGTSCGVSVKNESSARLAALLMDRFFTNRGHNFWSEEEAAYNREQYILWREIMIIMQERDNKA